jgi:hypothetical protein
VPAVRQDARVRGWRSCQERPTRGRARSSPRRCIIFPYGLAYYFGASRRGERQHAAIDQLTVALLEVVQKRLGIVLTAPADFDAAALSGNLIGDLAPRQRIAYRQRSGRCYPLSHHSPVWPQRRDLIGALEASRDIALRLGSTWDVLPGATRKTFLDYAHDLIDLTWRAEDRRGRYRGKPRRIMLRHPDMDLNALGAL